MSSASKKFGELNDLVERQQGLNHRHDVDALRPGLNGHCVQVLERVRVADAAILESAGYSNPSTVLNPRSA